MAEAKIYTFDFKELAEALIKQQGLHEGMWGIWLEFGIQGANIHTQPNSQDFIPAAIVPVLKVGLQKFETVNNLTVDAARVNPAPARTRKPMRSAKTKK